MPAELFGPYALTAALLIAVGVLWREDRKQLTARLDDLTTDRNYWRDLALRGTAIAQDAVRKSR